MKTFNRNTVSNLKQAKKQAKQLRDLRKCGGNISIHEGSKSPKRNFIVTVEQEGWDGFCDGYDYGGAYA